MPQNIEGDFSGGVTDYYLDPAVNKHGKLDNWLLTKDKTTTVRCGSRLYNVTYARPEASRMGKVLSFLDKIFMFGLTKLWRYETTGWVNMSSLAFPSATSQSNYSVVEQNNHLVMTSTAMVGRPRKAYKDNAGVWRVFTAGLPAFTFSTPLTVSGKVYGAVGTTITVTDATNTMVVGKSITVTSATDPFVDGTWTVATRAAGSFTFIVNIAPAVGGTLTYSAASPNFKASVNESKNFLYFFVATRKYTITGGVEFKDYGAVTVVQATNMPDMSLSGRTITITPSTGLTWPHPPDTASDFYDQTNLKISIYRTKTDGTVGYLVDEVAVGYVGTFVDNKRDSSLGEEVYINGDVLDWEQPPIAKFVTQCQDIVWYANVIETETGTPVTRPYRIRQSIQFGIDKCPSSFYVDVDGDITGMSSVGDFPIVFTNRKCWRLEGFVDTQGNGFTRKILISDTVGCINNDSIIQSQRGIAFAGLDGFYFTDGYNITRVSDDLSLSYPQLLTDAVNLAQVVTVQAALRVSRINGCYDRGNDRYWWSVQTDGDHTDNDSYVIFDANFGIAENGSFTTASSGDDFSPSASMFFNGNLFRADSRGYLFEHRDELFEEVVVDSRPSPVDWITKAVPYDYISSARSMGDSTITKWAGVVQMVFVNLTDITIQPQTTDDDQKDWKDLKEMRFRGNYVWGQASLIWGDEVSIWNYRSFIFFERRFPRGSLRFTYKQLRLKPSYTVIMASLGVDAAIVETSGNTVTLTGSGNEWSSDMVGYFLHFNYAGDPYGKGYEILTYTSPTVVVVDPSVGGFLGGTYEWEVRGYRKGERPAMRNHIIMYEPFGDSQHGWRTTDGAGNG